MPHLNWMNWTYLPRILQWLALVGALIGAGFWTRLLAMPAAPVTLEAPIAQAAPVETSAAAAWFDSLAPRLDIAISGLMATDEGAVAILSVNDGPAKAYLVGEQLGREARLTAIEQNAVVVEQAGESQRVVIAALPNSLHMPDLTRR